MAGFVGILHGLEKRVANFAVWLYRYCEFPSHSWSVLYAVFGVFPAKRGLSGNRPACSHGNARDYSHHHSRGDCHRHGTLLVHPEKGRLFAVAGASVHHSVAWHAGSSLRAGLCRVEGCARAADWMAAALSAPTALPPAAAPATG